MILLRILEIFIRRLIKALSSFTYTKTMELNAVLSQFLHIGINLGFDIKVMFVREYQSQNSR